MTGTRLRAIRTWIADHRHNFVLRALAQVSAKYLRAYDNLAQWDVVTNGEAYALLRVTRVADGAIFDVGANSGEWSEMASGVAPGRPIHAFELAPRTFERLAQRVSRLPQVIANPFGLGHTIAETTFHYYPDSDDRTSLVSLDDGFAKVQARGEIRTGDSYASASGVERIAYLKIDVEGFEMSVLHGFAGSFAGGAVAAVQFEHGPAHAATRHLLIDFVEFFESRGYTVCRMFPHHLIPLRYDPAQDENFTGANFLAVRRDLVAQVTG